MGSAENESEFSTSLPGAAAAEQLDAAALLAHVSQSDKTLQKVKRKVVSLSGQKGGVEPPLSGPAAARVARSEAFSHTSKDVTKWQPIVKKNREAENLKFPLNDPGQQKLSNAALVENFAPSGSMEDEIRSMLKQGGATEDSIRRYEELELNKLSVEDVKERRNQLNKLRNLMFYQEMKCRRIRKIKSKKYHKLLRRSNEKIEAKMLSELQSIDPEAAEQERLKLEAKRAKERLTLKHKNQSKWVKRVLERRDGGDTESRRAISAQLTLGESLKKKMDDMDDRSDDSADDGPSDEDDDARAERKVRELSAAVDEGPAVEKGVLSLGFMRRAADKKRDEARALLDELQQDDDDDDVGDEAGGPTDEADGQTKSRRSFAPGGVAAKADSEYDSDLDGPILDDNSFAVSKTATSGGRVVRLSGNMQIDAELQKSLQPNGSSTKVAKDRGSSSGAARKQRSAEQQTVQHESEPGTADCDDEQTSSNPWMQAADEKARVVKSSKKRVRDSTDTKQGGLDADGDDLIDTNATLAVAGPAHGSGSAKKQKSAKAVADNEDCDDDDNSRDEPHSGLTPNHRSAAAQRSLIEQGFAGATEEDDFMAEKEELIDRDKPKEVKPLPGWGSWAGAGVEWEPRKALVDKLNKKQREQAAKRGPRKDHNLKHVIINEKRDKKASQFVVLDVPYPFTSREQYERSLRQPIGPEFNTATAHEKMTKPHVIVKSGSIVDPIGLSNRQKMIAKTKAKAQTEKSRRTFNG